MQTYVDTTRPTTTDQLANSWTPDAGARTLRAGDRIADAHTLQCTGTVLAVLAPQVAVLWDTGEPTPRGMRGDTLQRTYRPDALERTRIMADAGARMRGE